MNEALRVGSIRVVVFADGARAPRPRAAGSSRRGVSLFNRKEASNMTAAKGFVVPAGGGKHFASPTPGRSFALKLLGHETNESVMMFEETLPPGTASLFHLHRDSDEVAWVLAGEITFKIGDEVTVGGPGTCAFMPREVPHAWKNTGGEAGRVLFLYTPAAAGGLVEELSQRRPANPDEHNKLFQRHRWEVVGQNPL
jgi:quercetin dioxygenase-like cupin family protein